MGIFNHTETKCRGHEVPPDCPSVSIYEFMEKTTLSTCDMERILDVSENELCEWMKSGNAPNSASEGVFNSIKRIYDLMTCAFNERGIPEYLNTKRSNFGGRTPLDVLVDHDFGLVEGDLLQLIEGTYV